MAMLLIPRVFRSIWNQHLRPQGYEFDETNFWEHAIPLVKKQFPDFVFIAEVYWFLFSFLFSFFLLLVNSLKTKRDMEYELQTQGFDFTYDKKMYDRLKSFHSKLVIEHLWATPDFQKKSVRFLENHDEQRGRNTICERKNNFFLKKKKSGFCFPIPHSKSSCCYYEMHSRVTFLSQRRIRRI